jgi:hypothetical protein
VTLYGSGRGDDAFREQGERLCRLEGRARGIGFADGLTHITALRRVGGETENLAISGIDGYDTARFMFQESFSKLLEYRAQRERPVCWQRLRKSVCGQKQASDCEDISVCHCSKEKILRYRGEGLLMV